MESEGRVVSFPDQSGDRTRRKEMIVGKATLCSQVMQEPL